MRSLWFLAAFVGTLSGCSSDPADSSDGEPNNPPAPVKYAAGITEVEGGLVFATEEYTLEPGAERYVCFAANTETAANVKAHRYDARSSVHHFMFARTSAPEPDGMSDCPVLFRPTWAPLFVGATVDSEVDLPTGSAQILPTDTQLMVQLHLLNTTPDPITDQAVFEMTLSDDAAPTPVGIYAFGTIAVDLPPQQTTMVVSDCTLDKDVEIFGILPHMHYLGRSLEVQMGTDEGSLQTVWKRDPYDFDDQTLDMAPLSFPSGMLTRTTCMFDNTTAEQVGFGESTFDEMCFAVGFALGIDGVDGCIGGF